MKTKAKGTPAKSRKKTPRAVRPAPKPVVRRNRLLTPPELAEYRELLLRKRDELVTDMRQMQAERLSGTTGGSGAISSAMPTHMAELGSDTWEQSFTLRLVEDRHSLLREVDDALARVQAGTYGVCEGTGQPIPRKRLRVIPWARHCLEYACQRETLNRRTGY